MARPKGVLVPNITFFTSEGKLDLNKMEWHMGWMLENGVDGLFVTGSYGAGPLMSLEERVEVYKLAKKVVSGFSGKALIAHVGTADTSSAVALAKEAEKIGVDAVAAVPPFYYRYSDEEVIEYYKAIVESVSLPVYAYNNPTTTRVKFSVSTVEKLQEIGVAGLKDSSLDISFLSHVYYRMKNREKDFQVILGTEVGFLPVYFMGVDTMIGGMCNYVPELISHFYDLVVKGSDKAGRVYEAVMNLRKVMAVADSTVVSHMALYARGFDGGYPRQPMALPPRGDKVYEFMKEEIDKALEVLGS